MRIGNPVWALLLLFTLGACNEYPTYRYRLTVFVDTPEGAKQGSTVIEVGTNISPWPDPTLHREVVGEAAVIDLGKRGLLFALARGDPDLGWAGTLYSALLPSPKGLSQSEFAAYSVNAARNSKDPIVLPRYFPDHRDPPSSGYPLLVRFRDPTDYRTLERVNPDNLAESFGSGVKLQKIVVQITHDKPERRVLRYLPWLTEVKGQFDPNGTRVKKYGEFRNNLGSQSFDPEI